MSTLPWIITFGVAALLSASNLASRCVLCRRVEYWHRQCDRIDRDLEDARHRVDELLGEKVRARQRGCPALAISGRSKDGVASTTRLSDAEVRSALEALRR